MSATANGEVFWALTTIDTGQRWPMTAGRLALGAEVAVDVGEEALRAADGGDVGHDVELRRPGSR